MKIIICFNFRYVLTIVIFFGIQLATTIFAQPKYEVEGLYKNKAAQGFAIYGTNAYLFSETGICRVLNLKSGKVNKIFNLESSDRRNHCNAVSFGREKIKGGKVPVMYISECNSPYRCFVESVTESNSVLVQTISIDRKGEGGIVHDWVVDRKHNALYAVASLRHAGETIFMRHQITRYRLPRLSEGKKVVLSDTDAMDSFEVLFPNLLQGATIKGNYLYLPTGRNSKTKSDPDVARREVIVVNLKCHVIERKINLMGITDLEPEDCDFYKGRLLLYCGQGGGLFDVPLK